MKITPTYVTLAQAELLKKNGFNDLIPEQWQVIEWFEIVFKIYIDTKCINSTRGDNFEYCIHKNNDTIKIKNGFNSRKEAYSAAIDYVLEIW